jgi:hypothetical protein
MTGLADNQTGTPASSLVPPTTKTPEPFSKVTISQAEGIHPDYIKMDSDIYSQGDVIEFFVVNEGFDSLPCWIPHSYQIYRQDSEGSWELQITPVKTFVSRGYELKPGESTPVQTIQTDDKIPGLYKIVSDCGVSREFNLIVPARPTRI